LGFSAVLTTGRARSTFSTPALCYKREPIALRGRAAASPHFCVALRYAGAFRTRRFKGKTTATLRRRRHVSQDGFAALLLPAMALPVSLPHWAAACLCSVACFSPGPSCTTASSLPSLLFTIWLFCSAWRPSSCCLPATLLAAAFLARCFCLANAYTTFLSDLYYYFSCCHTSTLPRFEPAYWDCSCARWIGHWI